MAGSLVDSDVFIDHLRGARAVPSLAGTVAYSVVTRAELLSGHTGQEDAVRRLLSAYREIEVDREIAELAGRIRRQTGVRITDALIAATAITRGFALVTRNRSDFERIPRLELRA